MAVDSGRFLAAKWEIQKTPSFGGVWLGRPNTLPPPFSSPKVSHGGRLFPRLIAPGRPGMRRAAHDASGDLRPAWQDRTRPAPAPPWRCALAARHAAPESANARPARGKYRPPRASRTAARIRRAAAIPASCRPPPENAPAPASHARHGKSSHRWAYLEACAPCRPLTLAGLRRILRPSPRKRRRGFDSPEYQGGRPPPSGFFTSAARQAPMGGPCGRASALPVPWFRSVNPHGSARPDRQRGGRK